MPVGRAVDTTPSHISRKLQAAILHTWAKRAKQEMHV